MRTCFLNKFVLLCLLTLLIVLYRSTLTPDVMFMNIIANAYGIIARFLR
jgi:hypothetical protein